jgi:drug/metabolite transporter (DMT)-like permease
MRPSPGVVLAFALVGISFAGPLVKLSNADPLAIAAWRLGFSLVIVAGFLLATGEWRQWRDAGRATLLISALGGIFLALHFWAWNASIHMTTIAASVTLVSIQPAIVAALSAILLREAPTWRQIGGMAVAITGAFLIALPDFRAHQTLLANSALLGNLLAVSGAVTASLYYTIGRYARGKLGVWSYVAVAYSAAFLTLLVIAGWRELPLAPQPEREVAIFAALALGPMLLGHTGMNWALRFLPAYVVNLLVLGEPVGATVLGAVIPAIHQVPSAMTIVGGIVVLTGVVVAATGATTATATATATAKELDASR